MAVKMQSSQGVMLGTMSAAATRSKTKADACEMDGCIFLSFNLGQLKRWVGEVNLEGKSAKDGFFLIIAPCKISLPKSRALVFIWFNIQVYSLLGGVRIWGTGGQEEPLRR
jgi:hypothetical protein